MVAIAPWLLLHKFRRGLKRANHGEIDINRWTLPQYPIPAADKDRTGPHLVFAGENFGELVLVKRLTEALREARPDVRITWMVRDATTLEHVREKNPEQAVCIWPFDFILPVGRFLRDINPDILVLTERFRSTNLVCGSAHVGAKIVLINGRFKRLHPFIEKVFRFLYAWTFESISVALMQSKEYADRALRFSGPNTVVRAIGDLKEDFAVSGPNAQTSIRVREWLAPNSDLPIFAAGSTDGPEEEAFVIEAFRQVRAKYPCRLLLAPRYVTRTEQVCELVKEAGLTYSLRSTGESSGDVLILDTLGELSSAYQFCAAAYVGGSFNGMGHNVLEPVLGGVAVSYGMRRGHFKSMQKMCEKFGVGFRVANSEELSGHWLKVLEDSELREVISEGVRRLHEQQVHSFDATLNALKDLAESVEH